MANQRQINEKIEELIKGFDISYGRAVAPFTKWLLEQLKDPQGRTTRQIVNEGWEKFEVSSAIEGVIVSTTATSATIQILAQDPEAIVNQKKLITKLKTEPWAGDGVNLNSRMAKGNTKTKQFITRSVKENFKWVRDYEDNFKELQRLVLTNGKVDESILRKQVREMTREIRTSGFSRDFEKELARLENDIKTLSEMNYNTSDTKKAYKRFMRGVKGKELEAFEKAVEEAVKKKSKYIARRIARTEQARASTEAYILMTQNDDDLQYYKWNLDASHKILDICDVNAGADFGLGRGVYPKDKLPSLPAHPHCICFLTEYYPREEINPSDFDYSKGGNEYLSKLSRRKQNEILTSKARGDQFRKGENWNNAIRTIEGNSQVKDPKVRFKEAITSKYL